MNVNIDELLLYENAEELLKVLEEREVDLDIFLNKFLEGLLPREFLQEG